MSERKRETLVIIGSGPAAWTAAVYAARANLDPVVYEGEPSREMIPGGQLMWTTDIENFPGFPEGVGGQELMDRMKEQAVKFGTRAIMENIVEVDFTRHPFVLKPSYSDAVEAVSVIVATGARANWIGLPNEMRLAQTGGGVSACAVCDGALPFFRDKVLAVVGGGDSAMEEATYLTKFAREVVIIHRRGEFRASKVMAERALAHPKIRVEWNTQVVDVLGDDVITGLRLKDTVTGEEREMEVGRAVRRHRAHAEHRVPERPAGADAQRLRQAAHALAHLHQRPRRVRRRRRDGRLLPPGDQRRGVRLHGGAGGGALDGAPRR